MGLRWYNLCAAPSWYPGEQDNKGQAGPSSLSTECIQILQWDRNIIISNAAASPSPPKARDYRAYLCASAWLTPSSCFLSIVSIQHKLRQELRVCLAALGPHRTTERSEGPLHLTAIGHKPCLWAQDACIHLSSRYLHLDASQASHT